MLLVATNREDPAADFLILRLQERLLPFLRINTERWDDEYSLSLFANSEGSRFELRTGSGVVIRTDDLRGVYLRDPRPPMVDDVAYEDRDFARREATEQLRSFWRMIDDNLWLNHPRNLWLASNKIEQLGLARKIGFSIPETIVTAVVDEIKDFFFSCGEMVVVKALKYGFQLEEQGIKFVPTRRLVATDLCDLAVCAKIPSIYQRLIAKRFDVRVTVVGDDVFATAIHSQAYEATKTDWRVSSYLNLELSHEPIQVPRVVAEMCRAITRANGLRYSAIDLICTPDGEYFFLELNPNGQWVWLEQLAEHPIRDSIIDTLLVGNSP